MTCREKLAIEHPEKINTEAKGGCLGCPHEYGYLPVEMCSCRTERFGDCEACWNLAVQGTEPPVTGETTSASTYTCEQIDIHKIIDEAMEKKDREVSIFIMKNNTSVYVRPATNTKPHWIYREGKGKYEFECSECGYYHEFESPFCPECGEKLSKSEV